MEKQLKEIIKKYEKELKELESYKLKLTNVYFKTGNEKDKIACERVSAKIEVLKEVLKDLRGE